MMTDYISRQAAIEYIKLQYWRRFEGMTIEEAIITMISEVPSAVVRCKDCKHYNPEARCVGGTYHGCKVLDGPDGCEMEVDEFFFCAYGERRDPDA